MRVQKLFDFIKERWAIYQARQLGQPRPWTKDPILQKYRFCNVHRECDKVTVWIAENWRAPHRKDSDLWFAMVVARMFNLPSTLQIIKYPVPFYPERIRNGVHKIQLAGLTVYSGAYMIRCDCQEAGKTKADYLVDKVFKPMWKEREVLRPRQDDTLDSFHKRLMNCYGMGSFMAAQVVADVKFVEPLKQATDWWTWAAPGPGSMRGLNRVLERPVKTPWNSEEWLRQLNLLQTKIDPLAREAGVPRISAQDLQNTNCEFDKFERARLGEGRPKQLYKGVE